MIQPSSTSLSQLYAVDETAWLEAMANLIRQGAYGDLDYDHLEEYLCDMARLGER